MATQVWFKNPRTGERTKLKVGFSWTCFFFWGFGIPLFLSKLNTVGVVAVGYNLICYASILTQDPTVDMYFGIFLIYMVVGVYLGIKANEMAAKNYLKMGWERTDPESMGTAEAVAQWELSAPDSPPSQPQA